MEGSGAVTVVAMAIAYYGENPALPDVRATRDGCREQLEGLHGEAQRFVGPFPLEEPGEEEPLEQTAVGTLRRSLTVPPGVGPRCERIIHQTNASILFFEVILLT
jgi:hypothetical protein